MANIALTFNVLNEKLITSINLLDGFTLADNLIKNHKVDYLYSAVILAEPARMFKTILPQEITESCR